MASGQAEGCLKARSPVPTPQGAAEADFAARGTALSQGAGVSRLIGTIQITRNHPNNLA